MYLAGRVTIDAVLNTCESFADRQLTLNQAYFACLEANENNKCWEIEQQQELFRVKNSRCVANNERDQKISNE